MICLIATCWKSWKIDEFSSTFEHLKKRQFATIRKLRVACFLETVVLIYIVSLLLLEGVCLLLVGMMQDDNNALR